MNGSIWSIENHKCVNILFSDLIKWGGGVRLIFDEHARVNIIRKLNAGAMLRQFTLNQLVRKPTIALWVPPKKLYHKSIHEKQKMVPQCYQFMSMGVLVLHYYSKQIRTYVVYTQRPHMKQDFGTKFICVRIGRPDIGNEREGHR